MDEIEKTAPERGSESAPDKKKNVGRTIGLVAIVVVILLLLGGAGYGLVKYPGFTSVLRDIAIIVLALVTIVIGLFLVILIFQLQSLIALLRDEIKPILDSANQTASTVRGTTTFVSDAVVRPMIAAASYASAVRETVKVLAGGNRKNKHKATSQPASKPQEGNDISQ
jgi:tetrahydromethanopterin S-methyltransferase subunit G